MGHFNTLNARTGSVRNDSREEFLVLRGISFCYLQDSCSPGVIAARQQKADQRQLITQKLSDLTSFVHCPFLLSQILSDKL